MATWAPPPRMPSAGAASIGAPARRYCGFPFAFAEGLDPEHVAAAKEVGDEARSRPLVQALRLVALHHPAAVHDRDAAAHGQRLLLVVRDVEESRAGPLVDAGKLGLHGAADLLVERGERLIEEKHARRRRQRARQRHPLLLAAAEIGHALVGEPGKPDQVDHLGDTPARSRRAARRGP